MVMYIFSVFHHRLPIKISFILVLYCIVQRIAMRSLIKDSNNEISWGNITSTKKI